MKYKVTSSIERLEQKVRSNIKIHDHNYPRTVEWLKENSEDDFLTKVEAISLKEYLDKKSNFSNNTVVEIKQDDVEFSTIDSMLFAKQIDNGKVSVDVPIHISECAIFSDYNLKFEIVGYLNTNDLT